MRSKKAWGDSHESSKLSSAASSRGTSIEILPSDLQQTSDHPTPSSKKKQLRAIQETNLAGDQSNSKIRNKSAAPLNSAVSKTIVLDSGQDIKKRSTTRLNSDEKKRHPRVHHPSVGSHVIPLASTSSATSVSDNKNLCKQNPSFRPRSADSSQKIHSHTPTAPNEISLTRTSSRATVVANRHHQEKKSSHPSTASHVIPRSSSSRAGTLEYKQDKKTSSFKGQSHDTSHQGRSHKSTASHANSLSSTGSRANVLEYREEHKKTPSFKGHPEVSKHEAHCHPSTSSHAIPVVSTGSSTSILNHTQDRHDKGGSEAELPKQNLSSRRGSVLREHNLATQPAERRASLVAQVRRVSLGKSRSKRQKRNSTDIIDNDSVDHNSPTCENSSDKSNIIHIDGAGKTKGVWHDFDEHQPNVADSYGTANRHQSAISPQHKNLAETYSQNSKSNRPASKGAGKGKKRHANRNINKKADYIISRQESYETVRQYLRSSVRTAKQVNENSDQLQKPDKSLLQTRQACTAISAPKSGSNVKNKQDNELSQTDIKISLKQHESEPTTISSSTEHPAHLESSCLSNSLSKHRSEQSRSIAVTKAKPHSSTNNQQVVPDSVLEQSHVENKSTHYTGIKAPPVHESRKNTTLPIITPVMSKEEKIFADETIILQNNTGMKSADMPVAFVSAATQDTRKDTLNSTKLTDKKESKRFTELDAAYQQKSSNSFSKPATGALPLMQQCTIPDVTNYPLLPLSGSSLPAISSSPFPRASSRHVEENNCVDGNKTEDHILHELQQTTKPGAGSYKPKEKPAPLPQPPSSANMATSETKENPSMPIKIDAKQTGTTKTELLTDKEKKSKVENRQIQERKVDRSNENELKSSNSKTSKVKLSVASTERHRTLIEPKPVSSSDYLRSRIVLETGKHKMGKKASDETHGNKLKIKEDMMPDAKEISRPPGNTKFGKNNRQHHNTTVTTKDTNVAEDGNSKRRHSYEKARPSTQANILETGKQKNGVRASDETHSNELKIRKDMMPDAMEISRPPGNTEFDKNNTKYHNITAIPKDRNVAEGGNSKLKHSHEKTKPSSHANGKSDIDAQLSIQKKQPGRHDKKLDRSTEKIGGGNKVKMCKSSSQQSVKSHTKSARLKPHSLNPSNSVVSSNAGDVKSGKYLEQRSTYDYKEYMRQAMQNAANRHGSTTYAKEPKQSQPVSKDSAPTTATSSHRTSKASTTLSVPVARNRRTSYV